jgi:uncharacterized protein
MTNRLARETSPYLLQHANNPVDWYPWGDEALNRARAEDKPILLSIGYSACHWCHVMAHESFENAEIAAFMSEYFINIKVDREERPDLDSVYMEAVQSLTGRGGWPLTVFLTPARKPFFGGTYFPPDDRYGLPGFLRILHAMHKIYIDRRQDVEEAAQKLMAALAVSPGNSQTGVSLTTDILDQAFRILKSSFDGLNGGFGTAPKFPQPTVLEFLMRYFHRTNDQAAWDMVDLTLRKMAQGGIYDQIGGGFHRYSTDAYWLVPHFEKMLYDNALLSQVYLHAYLISDNLLFRSIAENTLGYVLKEMSSLEGGFFSSQDADTEGVEGRYYLWTPGEIIEALGDVPGRVVNEYFGVSAEGNFTGRNVLYIAAESPVNSLPLIERAKTALLRDRERRVKPGRDEKIIASWNGLMLASIAEASCILGAPDYLDAARANGAFLVGSLTQDGCLGHTYKDGSSKIIGFLQDYALVIEGLLMLHQATFEGKWLRESLRLGNSMIDAFWDEAAGKFFDSRQADDLIVRPRNISDSVIPSGSSAATMVLLKLARLTGDSRFEQIAARLLTDTGGEISIYPLNHSHWLCALEYYLASPQEIAIIGGRNDPRTLDLLRTLYSSYLPNKMVAARDPDDQEAMPDIMLLEDRKMVNSRPTVYICQRYVCQEPVSDPAALAVQLLGKRKYIDPPISTNKEDIGHEGKTV